MQQVSPAAERAWIALLRAAPSLIDRVETALKAQGFPPLGWYDVLWELERAEVPQRQRDLAARLLVARYNLSRLIDRLEAEGLITREDCPDDARGQALKLTSAGKNLRQRMWPVYAAAIRSTVAAKLSDAQANSLARLLDKLR